MQVEQIITRCDTCGKEHINAKGVIGGRGHEFLHLTRKVSGAGPSMAVDKHFCQARCLSDWIEDNPDRLK